MQNVGYMFGKVGVVCLIDGVLYCRHGLVIKSIKKYHRAHFISFTKHMHSMGVGYSDSMLNIWLVTYNVG